MGMDLTEARKEVIRQYVESGRKERDDQFRRSLALGPTERRWLGWSGARVLVLRAYLGHEAPLCPTSWVYEFKALKKDSELIISPEINFCDDDNILNLLYSWSRSERVVRDLLNEIEYPALMYHI
jgi:hypothetical protein